MLMTAVLDIPESVVKQVPLAHCNAAASCECINVLKSSAENFQEAIATTLDQREINRVEKAQGAF